jgi:hypothetical protein
MGKWEMSYGKSEIEEWKKDGWSFRIKTVKGKRYITRRKDGRERSLGRYDADLWRIIEGASEEVSKIEKELEAKRTIRLIVRNLMASQMYSTCVHNVKGYCHYMKFPFQPPFFNIINARIGKGHYTEIREKGKSEYWVFKTESFLCNNCPAYKQDMNVSTDNFWI